MVSIVETGQWGRSGGSVVALDVRKGEWMLAEIGRRRVIEVWRMSDLGG